MVKFSPSPIHHRSRQRALPNLAFLSPAEILAHTRTPSNLLVPVLNSPDSPRRHSKAHPFSILRSPGSLLLQSLFRPSAWTQSPPADLPVGRRAPKQGRQTRQNATKRDMRQTTQLAKRELGKEKWKAKEYRKSSCLQEAPLTQPSHV